jgi:hypothetical protein
MDKIIAFVVILLVAVGLSFVLSWPVMALWNGCLVGAVDSVREISWLQAWGISFLFNLFFKANVTFTANNERY